MTYFLYNKKNKKVKMMNTKSFKHFDTTKIATFNKTLTNEEKQKLKQGYIMKYDDGLKFEKPDYIVKKENIEELKEEVDNANDIQELKIIINKLIKLI